MNMNETITDVTLTKTCNIKADKDSAESKQVTLKVKFDGTTLQSVFDKALAGAVIQWQNGPGRKNFDKWADGQVIEIQFSAPGRTQVDPETAMVAKLQTMTPEEQVQYLKELAARASK